MVEVYGTFDNARAEVIIEAVEAASVYYHWWALFRVVTEAEFDLAIIKALANGR